MDPFSIGDPSVNIAPLFVRLTHWFNVLFLTLLARSGLAILAAHPKLYWNIDSKPGSEWLRSSGISWDWAPASRPCWAWARPVRPRCRAHGSWSEFVWRRG